MTISSDGLLSWTPQPGDAGTHVFKVVAADGGENGAEAAVQVVTLDIAQDPTTVPTITADFCFTIVAANGAVAHVCI